MAANDPLVLYSTNPLLKLMLQEKYHKDVHYVWCSECFDSTKMPAYSATALIPPSSNPANIYRTLKDDVARGDQHSAKIREQRLSFIRLAGTWEKMGKISAAEKDEIIYMVKNVTLTNWRPLVYVIPYAPVSHRVKVVPPSKRAGVGIEYIIEDLARNEFDLMEFG